MWINRTTVALAMLIVGSWLAGFVQTGLGTVDVHDVRFAGSHGNRLSGLLYVPEGVTATNKAPGILAIHGYINSRETQSGFAIELARRGFVVLAMDQMGHGYSDPPAIAVELGLGGPDGLDFLRNLPFVDAGHIGLEGHSMGGWAVLMAAADNPDGYEAMVLEGSSTGTLGAPDGTPVFPRNLLLVYSLFDEFSALMWGVPVAADIVATDKLKTLFGTDEAVERGRLYGDIEASTARRLTQPAVTHPGDHLSRRAIGDAVAWFQRVLDHGERPGAGQQIWYWKEFGTSLAFAGLIVLIFPLVDRVVSWPWFRRIGHTPLGHVSNTELELGVTALLMAMIPVLTFFPLQMLANLIIPANLVLPQQLTNGIMLWALGNGAILLGFFLYWQIRNRVDRIQLGLPADGDVIYRSALAAIVICAVLYGVLLLADFFFKVDFRFWVVALKLLSPDQFQMFLIYLIPFTAFFLMLSLALHNQLRFRDISPGWSMAANASILAGGFVLLLIFQYVPLLSGASLPIAQPLLTIVAFQFVPLMIIVALVSTWCFYRTEQVYLGAFVNGIFVTWYIVAGQATQAG